MRLLKLQPDFLDTGCEKLAQERDLLIEMDPQIAKAFHESVNISSK